MEQQSKDSFFCDGGGYWLTVLAAWALIWTLALTTGCTTHKRMSGKHSEHTELTVADSHSSVESAKEHERAERKIWDDYDITFDFTRYDIGMGREGDSVEVPLPYGFELPPATKSPSGSVTKGRLTIKGQRAEQSGSNRTLESESHETGETCAELAGTQEEDTEESVEGLTWWQRARLWCILIAASIAATALLAAWRKTTKSNSIRFKSWK